MKTAVYTICKNEIKHLDNWIHYGMAYDYRVILDTGSTDGTWEKLQEYAKNDPNLIIEQKIFTPWRFDVARNYNLSMVPEDVDWCLSPDLDEHFTKNTLDELTAAWKAIPTMTNLACDRFDVYSYTPRVGPPNFIPSNKIHKRHDYVWVQPIYEHLRWKHEGYENEQYSSNIYIVHNQDFLKEERSDLYIKMLTEEYETNPTNTWCLWFLVYHYYKSKNMEMFIRTASDYVRYCDNKDDSKYKDLVKELNDILLYSDASEELKSIIKKVLI